MAINRDQVELSLMRAGEHKIARGYEPVKTLSAHWIADPGLRAAIARYLEAERQETDYEMEAVASMTPYRTDG